MYFRKKDPETTCLYSADSTLPRIRSAASNSSFANGRSPFPRLLDVLVAPMLKGVWPLLVPDTALFARVNPDIGYRCR
jgi:hypothetical protein